MNKIYKNYIMVFLLLTGCSWFKSETERTVTVPEVYSVEFELDSKSYNENYIKYLYSCSGSFSINYNIKSCVKNGVKINNELCSHIHKDPLILISPKGYSEDSISVNGRLVGSKSYFCNEGELRTEKFELKCLDKFEKYSLSNNGVLDSCRPYPVYIEHNVITNSIGYVFEINDSENYKTKRINFPLVVKAYKGVGGICGYTATNNVFCQNKDLFGVDIGEIVEIFELSRGIKIKKFLYEGNTICILYEDGQVGCSQGKPYDHIIGTNGAAGRGIETHVVGTNKVIFERTSPLIPEYFGAKDIALLYSYNKQVSCALFEDNSIKCSGQIGYLSGSTSREVNIPITSYNKPIDSSITRFKNSKCPFPQIAGTDCFDLNSNTGEIGFINKELNQIGENEFIIGFIKDYIIVENVTNLYISSLGYLYTYSYRVGFERLHSLKTDQISYDGRYILLNKEIYYNQEVPILIERY